MEDPVYQPNEHPHARVCHDFLNAIERGDLSTIERVYAAETRVWHNVDEAFQTRQESMAVLHNMIALLVDRKYEHRQIDILADGFAVQHVLTGRLADGAGFRLPACLVCRVRDGQITGIQEYYDQAAAERRHAAAGPGLAPRPEHVDRELVVDFDIYNPAHTQDFYARWLDLRGSSPHPIVWTPRNGGHWIALRSDAIQKIYADHAHFSVEVQAVPLMEIDPSLPKGLPTTVNPPEHGVYRAIINPNFTRSSIAELEPHIRALTVELIEGFRASGSCEFVEDFARRLPLGVFMRWVNLPAQDREKLARLTDEIARPVNGPEQALAAYASMMEYLRPVVQSRRDHPGDDMLSRVVNHPVAGRPMTEMEALGMCFQLVVAGLDTVASILGFVMLHLAKHPEQRRQLRNDPAIVAPAVEEFLRRFPIVTMTRLVRQNIVFADTKLRADDLIMIPSMLSNLDEAIHDDPLKVDFARALGRITTFGAGPHFCPGANLARVELGDRA